MNGLIANIDDFIEEFNSLSRKLELSIANVNSTSKKLSVYTGSINTDFVGSNLPFLRGRIERAKTLIRSMNVTYRDVKQLNGGKDVQDTKAKLGDCRDRLNDIIIMVDSLDLIDGKKEVDSMTENELLQKAKETQDESLNSLEQCFIIIENTKELGTRIASELQNQTERLKGIGEDLNTIQSSVEISSKFVKALARRVGTDKFIVAMIFIIISGIIFIIVWKATHKEVSLPSDLM